MAAVILWMQYYHSSHKIGGKPVPRQNTLGRCASKAQHIWAVRNTQPAFRVDKQNLTAVSIQDDHDAPKHQTFWADARVKRSSQYTMSWAGKSLSNNKLLFVKQYAHMLLMPFWCIWHLISSYRRFRYRITRPQQYYIRLLKVVIITSLELYSMAWVQYRNSPQALSRIAAGKPSSK